MTFKTFFTISFAELMSLLIVVKLNPCILFQLNRVKAVEKEKDDLEGSKNEAVEYLSMENEIVHLKNKIYQKYV